MNNKNEETKMEMCSVSEKQGTLIQKEASIGFDASREIPTAMVNYRSKSGLTPTRGTAFSAGSDLNVTGYELIRDKEGRIQKIKYLIDTAMEIPVGFFGMLVPRSNVCKKPIILCNSVGVIDSDYRGELCAYFEFFGDEISRDIEDIAKHTNEIGHYDPVANPKDNRVYHVGERAVQIVLVPYVAVEWNAVEELSETERGEGGFGHTGIK